MNAVIFYPIYEKDLRLWTPIDIFLIKTELKFTSCYRVLDRHTNHSQTLEQNFNKDKTKKYYKESLQR